MKFFCTRTSARSDDKPCEEAYQDTYVYVDVRTTDDPKKIPFGPDANTDWWYENGRNHRVENGRIKRDFDMVGWFVDIESLEELMAFVDRYGGVVLTAHSFYNPSMPKIEIYDDYRE